MAEVKPTFFHLIHVHLMDHGFEDVKAIGFYESEEAAQEAIGRLVSQPGFRDLPDNFFIIPYVLDEERPDDDYGFRARFLTQ